MKTARIAVVFVLGAMCASAQLGGLLNKAKMSKSGGNTSQVLTQGQDLIAYVTLATDSGMKAVETLATVFPPEKVQNVAELAAKYNEMKTTRSDQNIDAESIQVASKAAEEMAKLDAEWQIHVKEKSAAVKNADALLALVILADVQAGTKAPETAKALQSSAENLRSDPTQLSKASAMLKMATVLASVGKDAPQQVTSYKTVRGIARKIADAEKVQLASDPTPDKVRDNVTLQTNVVALPE